MLNGGTVLDLGELELIERIRGRIGAPGRATLVGIGDDAAVLEQEKGLLLFTSDAFVESVHFRREYSGFREIGAKCMTANVSDIAAMGGFPTAATVCVCLPPDLSAADVDELYEGMLEAGAPHGVEIVGGDVVSSPSGLVVSIALLGNAARDRVVTRAGAVVGDAVVVTGELGAAEAGLRALEAGMERDAVVSSAIMRHTSPVARIAEAQSFIDVATPHAMIDISDGLASEARHIAVESGVGVAIHESDIPLSPAAVEVARRLGADPIEMALGGGEEFELMVTIPRSELERTVEHIPAVTGTKATAVGEIIEASAGVCIVRAGGAVEPLTKSGYEHLATSGAGRDEGEGVER